MNRKYTTRIAMVWGLLISLTMLAAFLLPQPVASQDNQPKPVYAIRIEGAVSPGTAGFLSASLKKAIEADAQAFLVELDTPGGLIQSTRTMVKSIMNAPIPVIIYVSPSGAQAASAGTMITMSGDVAAMAPGTNIGAAHPVAGGGKDIEGAMQDKVLNDTIAFAQGIAKERGRNAGWVKKAIEKSVSVTSDEAVALKVVDLVAHSRADLLQKINGRVIERGDLKVTLNTATAPVVELSETFRDRILRTLADPNIAYILMMLGLAGLYFELSHPGTILPGVVGGISLILAFYSFQTLPVNYAGIMLILLGLVLFILELKVTSFGMLTVGGLISLTLGSLMLFKTPQEYMQVSLSVLIPVLLTVGGFFVAITFLVVRAHSRVSPSGESGLVGMTGKVKEWDQDRGRVFVHGEWWHASGPDQLASGDAIEVTAVEGMRLIVKRIDSNNQGN
jgi:membrane-bound serine protease (ClpP class)